MGRYYCIIPMKPLYILKIGGSVATYKNKQPLRVRRALLYDIATEIKKARTKGNFSLVLIHGSGAAGHHLAKKYALHEGALGDPKKIRAALDSQTANQLLDHIITDIFISRGLPVTPCHTASLVIQNNKKVSDFNTNTIRAALENDYIPLLYGEMVFDSQLGMSVCSGDTLAALIARECHAQKIFFASDIDGIFTKDPHLFKDATLIESLYLHTAEKQSALSPSHNTDVTGGLLGKIRELAILADTDIETIEIFNGFQPKRYSQALIGTAFPHTTLSLQTKK